MASALATWSYDDPLISSAAEWDWYTNEVAGHTLRASRYEATRAANKRPDPSWSQKKNQIQDEEDLPRSDDESIDCKLDHGRIIDALYNTTAVCPIWLPSEKIPTYARPDLPNILNPPPFPNVPSDDLTSAPYTPSALSPILGFCHSLPDVQEGCSDVFTRGKEAQVYLHPHKGRIHPKLPYAWQSEDDEAEDSCKKYTASLYETTRLNSASSGFSLRHISTFSGPSPPPSYARSYAPSPSTSRFPLSPRSDSSPPPYLSYSPSSSSSPSTSTPLTPALSHSPSPHVRSRYQTARRARAWSPYIRPFRPRANSPEPRDCAYQTGRADGYERGYAAGYRQALLDHGLLGVSA